MSEKGEQLTEEEKERIARIEKRGQEILEGNKEAHKKNRECIEEILKEVRGDFNNICETVLLRGNEYQRAMTAEVLIKMFLGRILIRGHILSGVLDHVHQTMITDPLLSRIKYMRGKTILENIVDVMEEKFKYVSDSKDLWYVT